MTRIVRCPHCKAQVGIGTVRADIASPLSQCPLCKRAYIDKDMYEWAVIPWYKKLQFVLGNGRVFWSFLLAVLLGAAARSWITGLVAFSCLLLLSLLYVIFMKKEKIDASVHRAEDRAYVETLQRTGYPVQNKLLSDRDMKAESERAAE